MRHFLFALLIVSGVLGCSPHQAAPDVLVGSRIEWFRAADGKVVRPYGSDRLVSVVDGTRAHVGDTWVDFAKVADYKAVPPYQQPFWDEHQSWLFPTILGLVGVGIFLGMAAAGKTWPFRKSVPIRKDGTE